MLRLKHATRANALAETFDSGSKGLRSLLCTIALAFAVLLLAPAAGFANPITDENAHSGSSGWEVTQADAPRIEGYTDKTSVAPGERLGFHVSTNPTASYRINIYRLGWYGGTGARLMTCLPSCSSNGSGSSRSTPSPNSQTGKIDAGWSESQNLTIPSTWTTGEYVAEYVLKSGTQSGFARYSPFVVRSSAPQSSASSILIVVPFNTYLAYNNWGGTSSYENNSNKSIFKLAHATKVSFNRPFARREWRFWDYNLVRFMEKEGYDVSYVSDTDVDANPSILQQHRAVIVSGHSEYWSKNMRDGFDAARDAGTNIMFMGANDAYWQVRYEDSSCSSGDTVCTNVGNRRTMVIYKQEAADQVDPITDPSLKTIQWRQLGRPECELQGGVQYGSWFPSDGYADYTTTAAGASDPWAAGAGLSQGSTISGLVGFEFDSFFPGCNVPGTPTILFQYQGAISSADIDAAAVKYTANASGARVFSSGTEQWVWGLDSYRWDPTLFTGIPPTNTAIQQYTRNMLADMTKPAAPVSLTATRSGNTITLNTTGQSDSRVTSYKVYRHSGSGTFQPGDAGVSLVCQSSSGDCTDTQTTGTWRYAVVAVDQWNSSAPALSQAINFNPPVAANDSATVSEDAAATAVPVLSNDNASGGTLSIASVTQAAHGTVVITGGGTGLTYQPVANYCNTPPGTTKDTFTYTLAGGNTATVTMTVNCVDDGPVAARDPVSVLEDSAATAVNVLTNDTDVDGGTKEIASFTQPAHGTVSGIGTSGHWTDLTYRPNANYCNFPGGLPTDDFTYTLNGGSTATVAVTVDCKDDPPVANDDAKTLSEDAAATAIDVLANDTDVEGDAINIASKTDPAHGTVVITGAGTGLTYQPSANYCGSDSFTYTVNGGDTANVAITVNCVDDSPVAADDSKTFTEDDPATAINPLANDTDTDGGTKEITSFTSAAHGTVTGVGTSGHWTDLKYQPNANYCGPDSFNYTLNGGDTATASMTVSCVDDPPVANDDSKTLAEDDPATALNPLGNDTDADAGPKEIVSFTQPSHGTLTGVGTSGHWTNLNYQPNTNYCGPDSFSYTVNGGDTANVAITVGCVDDSPNATHDGLSVTEDDAATALSVLTNDTDTDGGTKEIASFTQPTHGTVTGVGTSGHWSDVRYQPSANYCNWVVGHPELAGPSDDFNYTLNGGSTTSVSMTVDCVNDPPDANPDSATVNEDAPATAVPVLGNDADVENDAITIASVDTTGTHGTVQITGGGTGLTYQPNPNYCNTPPGTTKDTFTYTVNGTSAKKTATVSMAVTCVDDPAVANNDSATMTEDAAATAIPVLNNDTDVDGDAITITGKTNGSHGTVAITGGGTGLTYQPAANYCGPDSFSYTVNGGDTANVSVTVNCVDDPPVANDDSKTLSEDDAATAVNVLANDTDVENDAITITAKTNGAHGSVAITGGGTGLTYAPNANYCGTDSFSYTVNGGDTANVAITVTCVDDPPVAADDSKSLIEDDAATALGVLGNDTDTDAGTKEVTSFTAPAHGAVTGVGTANHWSDLKYQPAANYCGSDSFTYTLNGGDTATVSLAVSCVNDPPVANDDAKTLNEDDSATAVNVLGNDTDVENDAITITAKTNPSHGTVAITGGGTGLTYQPAANYCGTDSFSYTVNGGDTANVAITVTCMDDPPAAADDSKTLTEDAAATAIDVLGNDTDIDAGPKAVNSVTQPANGTVVNTGSGLTYKPSANYCNTQQGGTADTFTYTLNGGSQGTVSVTVTCVDDAPAATDDSKSVTEDSAATALNPLANDTDVDGGLKEITAFTQPDHGTVTGVGSSGHWNDLRYQPNGNYCGPDSFTYTVNGGDGGTVSVSVSCVDDVPVAVDDSKTVTEGDAATAINVLSNDTDIDGGAKSIQSVGTTDTHGTVQITGGGSGLTYKPDDGYCNNPAWGTPESPDTFTYTLNGGATATVSVTVDCVPASAHDDSATMDEGAAATPIHVLGNDTSLDDRPITITSNTAPAHGTVAITGGGTGLSYQPDAGYCNKPGGSPDTFTYKVTGGSQATVSVTVDCTPPVANDDPAAVIENSDANAIDVLGNDQNPGHGPMLITSTDQPDHGTVAITGGGTGLTYKPDEDYCNNPAWASPESPDTFNYTVTSGSSATVSVTVDCTPPTPNDDEFILHGNTGANPLDVLANDKAVDSRPMRIDSQLVHEPGKGTVVIAPDGSGLTYKPDPGACGNDSFEYRLNGGNSATAWITIDCSDPPQAVDDAASVTHGAPATAVLVLSNDFDTDGGPMSISSVTQPVNGVVVRNSDGSGLTYQPDAGYCNNGSTTDNFTYTLNGDSTATVSMTVTCPAVKQTDPPQQQDLGVHATSKKCKKGFKKVKGKCRKKKKHKRK